ncbi:hypothetical protein DEO72_LG1g2622 [Vigna unguiculata]|uniref:Uncharacterized protein n=1 Tax=Vigna unguiculata TaxID=3917 RepID=A0A4D6KQW5_VIGUN|nr:hypothetical protein DEO72_LG1g2622 [Vigna unguiculata]
MLRIIHRNARAIYLDPSVLATTSTLTLVTLTNQSSTQGFVVFLRHHELNSRDAIPSPTRGMPRAEPLSRAQLKGYVPSSTQGTPTSRPLRYRRSLVDHAHHSKHNANLLQQNRLAGDTYRQALSSLVFTTTATIAWRAVLCHQAPCALDHRQTQADRSTIEEGNLSGPIRTGHNQHTHTSNTHQPELNSRVPRVHPPSRAQLEGCHSELNSRNATCLTPISSSTQGIRSELNSRNTNKPTFKIS